ncbi:MAG TPA: type II toxin-antitoxin system VapC family toxin [Polyangia bacterium]
MATADETYIDPSALRCLYIHDSRSRVFCAWRSRVRGGLPLTPFGRAELVNSIALAVFRKDISSEVGDAALKDLDQDIEDGRLYLTDLLWRQALDRTVDLSRAQTPKLGTRALDVLHVASALVLGCRRFVTYDARQAKLAQAARLRVLSPA